MLKRYKLKNYHFQLIIYMCILTIIGIMIIGSVKPEVQNKQIFGFAAGLVLMVIVSLIDYSFLLKFPWLYYVAMIGLLAWVFIAGVNRGGATRWIKIAGIQFQPSELAKLAIIVFFAYFFMKYQEKVNTVRVLFASFVLVGIPLVMILKQPDLSTTIVTTFIFVVLLFIAGLSYKIIVSVLAVAVPSIVIGLTYVIQLAQSTDKEVPYQMIRVLTWLYPTDPRWSQKALQQQNAIMAIGSGQVWGKGLNNSAATSMKNGDYIIEPQTDFIFAALGEELGFVGCAVVILLLLLVVVECIYIGSHAKDLAGRLICCGMGALVGFQAFVNICVNTGLMPNTGIPLPFVSYGLTSIVSIFIGMGLVLNVGLQAQKY